MKIPKELDNLNKEVRDKYSKINAITDKLTKIRKEEVKKLIGVCISSDNKDDFCFRKILDYEDNVLGGSQFFYFIFEEVGINSGGEPYIKITSDQAYLNKEWFNEKIPVFGWTKEITLNKYLIAKDKVVDEMLSRNKLKKFLSN